MTELGGDIIRRIERSERTPVIPTVLPKELSPIPKDKKAKYDTLWAQTKRIADQDDVVEEREDYVEDFPFVVSGKAILVFGDSENGKTAIMRWAIRNFLRDKPKGAVFIITENPDTITMEVRKIMAGVDAPNWEERLRFTEGDYEDYKDVISQMKIVCHKLVAEGCSDIFICVDTATHALGEVIAQKLDFNDRVAVAAYVGACKQLAATIKKANIGSVIITTHHTNNPNADGNASDGRPANSRAWYSQHKIRANVYKTGDTINVRTSGQDFGKPSLVGYQIQNDLLDYIKVDGKESADTDVIQVLKAVACFYIAEFMDIQMNATKLQQLMGMGWSTTERLIHRLRKDHYLANQHQYGKLELSKEHLKQKPESQDEVNQYIADLCEPYGLEPFAFRLENKQADPNKKPSYRIHFS